MKNYTKLLTDLYSKYNPEKIADVPNLLNKYNGREKELISSLFVKYSVNPWDFDFYKYYIESNFKEYISAFYGKFNPDKLNEVDKLVEKYKDDKETFIKQLCSKYKIEPFSLVDFIDFKWIERNIDEFKIENEKSEERKIVEKVQLPQTNIIIPPEKKKNNILLIVILAIIIIGGGGFAGFYFYTRNVNRNQTTQMPQTVIKEPANEQINIDKERQLPINSVTTSSFMPSKKSSLTYFPQNTIDDDLQTWWTPAPPNSDGTNSWLKFEFNGMVKVVAIEILNGSHYPNHPTYGNLYTKNNRLLKITLEFSNGNSQMIELREIDEIQRISINPTNTIFIKLIPLEWAKGSAWNDLCISDFKAFGFPAANSASPDTPTIKNVDNSNPVGTDCEKYLKEYEKFVMDYIEIIKKYKKTPTDPSILSDYTKLLQQANDWTTKIENCKDDPKVFQKLMDIQLKISKAVSGL